MWYTASLTALSGLKGQWCVTHLTPKTPATVYTVSLAKLRARYIPFRCFGALFDYFLPVFFAWGLAALIGSKYILLVSLSPTTTMSGKSDSDSAVSDFLAPPGAFYIHTRCNPFSIAEATTVGWRSDTRPETRMTPPHSTRDILVTKAPRDF